jgi:hypothetical protein
LPGFVAESSARKSSTEPDGCSLSRPYVGAAVAAAAAAAEYSVKMLPLVSVDSLLLMLLRRCCLIAIVNDRSCSLCSFKFFI